MSHPHFIGTEAISAASSSVMRFFCVIAERHSEHFSLVTGQYVLHFSQFPHMSPLKFCGVCVMLIGSERQRLPINTKLPYSAFIKSPFLPRFPRSHFSAFVLSQKGELSEKKRYSAVSSLFCSSSAKRLFSSFM